MYMKNQLNIIFVLLFLGIIAFSTKTFAQNQFHMTQSMIHQPFLNPASMSNYDNLNGSVFYKNQWVGFDGAPQMIGVNLNSPIGKAKKNRLGITFLNDRIGVNNQSEIVGSYGYTLKINDHSNLTFGVSATLKLMQSNFSEVSTLIVDPEFQVNTPTLALPNFKFGTYYRNKKFYIGMAIPNLLKNAYDLTTLEYRGKTSFDLSDMHLFLHAGYTFELNNDFDLNSSVLFKHVSGAPFQLDINSVLMYQKKFGFGINYRTSNEISGLLRFRLNPTLEFAYAYDFALSRLNKYSSGSHEIMLIFDVYTGEKKQPTPRY